MRTLAATNRKPTADELDFEREVLAKEQAFLADLRVFSEDLTVLRTNQYRVDMASELLESRMINILSFSTAIEMFHRLLNEREGRARLTLAEPVDDLSHQQYQADAAEASLEGVGVARSRVNDDIAEGNLAAVAAIELLESQNVARRIHMQLRKRLQSRARAPAVAIVRFAAKGAPPDPRVRARDAAQRDLRAAEAVSELALRRQQALGDAHRRLAERERALVAALRGHQAGQAQRDRALAGFREELHTNAALQLEINAVREANARLREALVRACDDGNAVKRERRIFENAQRNHELNEEDAQKGRTRITERKRAIARRDQGMEQHREGIATREVPVNELAEACEAKLREILEIEEQSHQVELRLNAVLRETRALDGQFTEGRGVGKSQRTIELEKVFGLVTKHEDVLN
jgi:hypothetical protein